MKCQIQYSGENAIILSSADIAQRVVKFKHVILNTLNIQEPTLFLILKFRQVYLTGWCVTAGCMANRVNTYQAD